MTNKLFSSYFKSNVSFTHSVWSRLSVKWLQKTCGNPDFIYVDTETSGFDAYGGHTYFHDTRKNKVTEVRGSALVSLQLGFYNPKIDKLTCLFIPWWDSKGLEEARALLARPLLKIGHNIKFDAQILRKHDIPLATPWFDTLSASRLVYPRTTEWGTMGDAKPVLRSHSLKDLFHLFSMGGEDVKYDLEVKTWLRRAKSAATRSGKPKDWINYSALPDDVLIPYALSDIWAEFVVYMMLEERLTPALKKLMEVEMECVYLAYGMENRGLMIDRAACQRATIITKAKEKVLRLSIIKKTRALGFNAFNPRSLLQLKELLREVDISPKEMTYKGKISTCKEVLTRIQKEHPKITLLAQILDLRVCGKLLSTYFESFLTRSTDDDPIIHCQLKVGDTATGRFACGNPPLQGIPRPTTSIIKGIPSVRSIFIPRPGYNNLYIDYSQIELKMFALFAQDTEMLKALKEGRDLHMLTSVRVFGDEKHRQEAKTINFGIIYGMGTHLLATSLGVPFAEAREILNEYYTQFPGIHRLAQRGMKLVLKQGFVIDMFHRPYPVSVHKSWVLINPLVQGSSAMVLKFAMIQLWRVLLALKLDKHASILLPIHDELIIEVEKKYTEEVAAIAQLAMEEILPVLQYKMKLTVDVSYAETTWEDKKKFPISCRAIKQATQRFHGVYKNVVVKHNLTKVDWFL
jgi:DNA polymerase-1